MRQMFIMAKSTYTNWKPRRERLAWVCQRGFIQYCDFWPRFPPNIFVLECGADGAWDLLCSIRWTPNCWTDTGVFLPTLAGTLYATKSAMNLSFQNTKQRIISRRKAFFQSKPRLHGAESGHKASHTRSLSRHCPVATLRQIQPPPACGPTLIPNAPFPLH